MTEITNTAVCLVLVVAGCGWLTVRKNQVTHRQSRAAVILALAVALLAGRRVVLDGTARGIATTALVSLALAGRRVDFGTHTYRPNRVYYRLAVARVA